MHVVPHQDCGACSGIRRGLRECRAARRRQRSMHQPPAAGHQRRHSCRLLAAAALPARCTGVYSALTAVQSAYLFFSWLRLMSCRIYCNDTLSSARHMDACLCVSFPACSVFLLYLSSYEAPFFGTSGRVRTPHNTLNGHTILPAVPLLLPVQCLNAYLNIVIVLFPFPLFLPSDHFMPIIPLGITDLGVKSCQC